MFPTDFPMCLFIYFYILHKEQFSNATACFKIFAKLAETEDNNLLFEVLQ